MLFLWFLFLCNGVFVCWSFVLVSFGFFSTVTIAHQDRKTSVHGILQARILEQVAIPFSRVSSLSRDQTQVFCSTDSLPSELPGKPMR